MNSNIGIQLDKTTVSRLTHPIIQNTASQIGMKLVTKKGHILGHSKKKIDKQKSYDHSRNKERVNYRNLTEKSKTMW